MVKVTGVPGQLIVPLWYVGVTSMVATTGALVIFTAVNDMISPVPDAPRPIAVLLLVHSYVVDPVAVRVEKMISAVLSPLQTTWFAGVFTCPAGLYITVTSSVVLQRPPLSIVQLKT